MKVSWECLVSPGVLRNASFCESLSQESSSSQLPVLIIEFRKIDEFMKVSWECLVSPGLLRNASFCESLSQ